MGNIDEYKTLQIIIRKMVLSFLFINVKKKIVHVRNAVFEDYAVY